MEQKLELVLGHWEEVGCAHSDLDSVSAWVASYCWQIGLVLYVPQSPPSSPSFGTRAFLSVVGAPQDPSSLTERHTFLEASRFGCWIDFLHRLCRELQFPTFGRQFSGRTSLFQMQLYYERGYESSTPTGDERLGSFFASSVPIPATAVDLYKQQHHYQGSMNGRKVLFTMDWT